MGCAEDSLRKYIEGDRQAFSSIINEFKDSIIFFISTYVKDPHTAEDIAADCFAQLAAYPSKFSFRSSLKSYLFSMAHNMAVNHIRRHSRITFLETSPDIAADDEFERLESSMLADERSKMLHDALPKLNDNYRTALYLVYFENMSYNEAAAAMNKTAKQIDNYVTRGRAALKKILTEEGFSYDG